MLFHISSSEEDLVSHVAVVTHKHFSTFSWNLCCLKMSPPFGPLCASGITDMKAATETPLFYGLALSVKQRRLIRDSLLSTLSRICLTLAVLHMNTLLSSCTFCLSLAVMRMWARIPLLALGLVLLDIID